jgi:hypothetical protein
MRFQKRQVYNKKTTPKFLPVIPLLPTKLSSDELKDKTAYITFTLQVSKGSGPGTPTYRKSIRTFEEGDPQQWMEVITSLKEIWAQNSIMAPTDMSNSAVAILKGDSLTWYETAMEDNRTDLDNESLMVPMTEQHIDDALLAVTNQIFPYRALEPQKQWMSIREEEVRDGSETVCHLDEPDQQLHSVLSKCDSTFEIFRGRANQYLGIRCATPLEESL